MTYILKRDIPGHKAGSKWFKSNDGTRISSEKTTIAIENIDFHRWFEEDFGYRIESGIVHIQGQKIPCDTMTRILREIFSLCKYPFFSVEYGDYIISKHKDKFGINGARNIEYNTLLNIRDQIRDYAS